MATPLFVETAINERSDPWRAAERCRLSTRSILEGGATTTFGPEADSAQLEGIEVELRHVELIRDDDVLGRGGVAADTFSK